MPHYGINSQTQLKTANNDLVILFTEVVRYFDNMIMYGHRTPEYQFGLYKKGRELISGQWVIIDKKKVVTYKDGINEKSMHNYFPSKAVDAVPYPIVWKDEKRMYYFAGHVMMLAQKLKEEGNITHSIRWGGDWDKDTQVNDQTFMDLAHFEIVE